MLSLYILFRSRRRSTWYDGDIECSDGSRSVRDSRGILFSRGTGIGQWTIDYFQSINKQGYKGWIMDDLLTSHKLINFPWVVWLS